MRNNDSFYNNCQTDSAPQHSITMTGNQESREFDTGQMRLNLTTATCQAPKQNEDIYTFRKQSLKTSGRRSTELTRQMPVNRNSSLSRVIKDPVPKHYEKTTVCYLTKFTPSNEYRRAKSRTKDWDFDTTRCNNSSTQVNRTASSSFQTMKTLGRSGNFLKSSLKKASDKLLVIR